MAGEDDESAGNEEMQSARQSRRTSVKGLKVKPSSAFLALNDKLLGAGRVSSVRLNLNAATAPVTTVSVSVPVPAPVPPVVRRNAIEKAQDSSALYDGKQSAAPSLKPEKPARKKTLGKGWFDMEPAVLDEQLKRDIKMVQLRNYMDPKRFYKNPDKSKSVLHVGTVIEGAGEYKSSRLTKKERQTTILGEILADKSIKQYTKRKYVEIQDSKPQGRKGKGKGKGKGDAKRQKKTHKLF